MTARDLSSAPTITGVLQRAAAHGYRLVRLSDGRQVGPSEWRWREFLRTASMLDRILAWERLPDPAPVAAPVRATPILDSLTPDELTAQFERIIVPATIDEFTTAARAVAHAIRECGLPLPPFRPAWFQPQECDTWADGLRGMTFHTLRPVRVYLRSGLDLSQLTRTALPELQNVVDAAHPNLSPDEREDRAEEFVRTAMARW